MRFPRFLTVPAAALAVVAAGLTIGAALPTQQVGMPTPTHITTTITCQEDEACWDCETMGNLICGNLTEVQKAAAWEAWDFNRGWSMLRTSTAEVKVQVTGYSLVRPQVTDGALTLQGSDGVWYLYSGVTN